MAYGKSDVPIRARKWGNAHRAKGGTHDRPLDGNAVHTQRWTIGDDASRADSQTGSSGAADATHLADAPLYGGQPASLLRGAGWNEGARSRLGYQGHVWAEP